MGTSPSLSQGGLFYLLAGRPFLLDSDGESQSLGLAAGFSELRASPSGRRLLLLQSVGDRPTIWVYDRTPRRLWRLTLPRSLYPRDASWVADERIVFDATRDALKGEVAIYEVTVRRNGTAGRPTLLLEGCKGPAVSPDGKLLAAIRVQSFLFLWQRSSLDVYDLATKKMLASSEAGAGGLFEAPVAWLDSRKVAVSEWSPSRPEAGAMIKVFEVVGNP